MPLGVIKENSDEYCLPMDFKSMSCLDLCISSTPALKVPTRFCKMSASIKSEAMNSILLAVFNAEVLNLTPIIFD